MQDLPSLGRGCVCVCARPAAMCVVGCDKLPSRGLELEVTQATAALCVAVRWLECSSTVSLQATGRRTRARAAKAAQRRHSARLRGGLGHTLGAATAAAAQAQHRGHGVAKGVGDGLGLGGCTGGVQTGCRIHHKCRAVTRGSLRPSRSYHKPGARRTIKRGAAAGVQIVEVGLGMAVHVWGSDRGRRSHANAVDWPIPPPLKPSLNWDSPRPAASVGTALRATSSSTHATAATAATTGA